MSAPKPPENDATCPPLRGFPLNARALASCSADSALASADGYVTVAGARDARSLVHLLSADSSGNIETTAGQVNALALVHALSHRLLDAYCEHTGGGSPLFESACLWLAERLGKARFENALRAVRDGFPASSGQASDGEVLRKLLFVWLANRNPAAEPMRPLFHDGSLRENTIYDTVIDSLLAFFEEQSPPAGEKSNLIATLCAPLDSAPHSLAGQLFFLEQECSAVFDEPVDDVVGALDLIQEEEHPHFGGHGPREALSFPAEGTAATEEKHFSADSDWMPQVVMIAKNVHVWLHQLSEQYGRSIERLEEIPDEELDLLAERGFTALWLIGIWERSPASRIIKQRCGNLEAAGSAYSLFDYCVAEALGGDTACEDLRRRTGARGIRLASDMVPNHMGVTSRWVYDHPERFVAVDECPFPSHSFQGPDLSDNARVEIKIEDGYYDHTDAAVVFKRVDRDTGHVQYIYHGNDGTSMPWNDTAQLNYMRPEVREAVMNTILHVARQFPIIRFDAAMTLTRKHYKRLWFPPPGEGGAIPTRSEHGMTEADFDRAMPREFWREVVDRVAREAPGTLLLAEAFWLLEGYFVRTLGMHRVYNSAFMHMLRDEDNAKYRTVIRNTLEYDPEVLKRFVNFMSNPDEETAVAQYGKGDQYFGICVLLATLPGTPMFGHGQFEGFAEKYGMEYRRSYWHEAPDKELIGRHTRQITPLLRERRLFAGVAEFLLYDCVTPDGQVNEDVFAYSNGDGKTRALVLYNNAYKSATGAIRVSVPYAAAGPDGKRGPVTRSLGEALGLSRNQGTVCVFRDQLSGRTYRYPCDALWDEGLAVELHAYECRVLVGFREEREEP